MKSSTYYIPYIFCLIQAVLITGPLKAQHQPDSIIGWQWDTLQENWEPDSRVVYTFNEENQILTDKKDNWYGNRWGNSRIKTNTYDDEGNLIQEKYDRWLGAWTNNSIYEYTYDEFGNQISDTRRAWADTGYLNEYKYIYGYDSDHNLINKFRQWWLPSGVWDTNTKETFTYDDQGNLIHELQEGWHNGWNPSVQVFYSYTDFNLLDTSVEQVFINPGFRNDVRIINLYNDSQKLVVSIEEEFQNNSWVFSKRNLYTYTAYNDLYTDITQLWVNGEWVNRNLFVYETDAEDRIISRVEMGWEGSWEKIDSIHYYFNMETSVRDQATDNTLSLFPNPATDQLTLQLEDPIFNSVKVEIYSAAGLRVYTGIKSPGEEINIRQFLPGRYYVKCRVGDRLVTKGFVKI